VKYTHYLPKAFAIIGRYVSYKRFILKWARGENNKTSR